MQNIERDFDQASDRIVTKRLGKVRLLASGLASVTCSPRRWGPFVDAYCATGFDHAFSVSFAQAGEDLALLQMFRNRIGRYLDIGAHHPSRFSVTRLLHDSGWSGVNVDANPQLIDMFRRVRPKDESVSAFVGHAQHGHTRPFHIFSERAISTGDPAWRDKFLEEGNYLEQTIQVPVISLAEITASHFGDHPPNLLNVDCEGADEEVLRSGDWTTCRPEVVVVETTGSVQAAARSRSVTFLQHVGYEIHFVLPMATILKRQDP
jgi:FkbM family methyltransferase